MFYVSTEAYSPAYGIRFQTEQEMMEKTLNTFAAFSAFLKKLSQLQYLKPSNMIFPLPHLLASRTGEPSVHTPFFSDGMQCSAAEPLFHPAYLPFIPSTCVLQVTMTFQYSVKLIRHKSLNSKCVAPQMQNGRVTSARPSACC